MARIITYSGAYEPQNVTVTPCTSGSLHGFFTINFGDNYDQAMVLTREELQDLVAKGGFALQDTDGNEGRS
jgi:hypothetical protein